MTLYFLELLKLRIIFGNLMSLCGGFFLASKHCFNLSLLFYDSISLLLIVGSACMLNNVIDCDIDQFMSRTKNRLLVKYNYFSQRVILLSIFFILLGFFICINFINVLCFVLFFLGLIVYIAFYSLYLKKKSVYSTIIGSISGSIPPVIGYCSVINCFDLCAINLLIMFCLWQIPHSYSICIMYFEDYKNANLPVFPVVYGLKTTRCHIITYIVLFFISTITLTCLNFLNISFFLVSFLLCAFWCYYAFVKISFKNKKSWAKKVFKWSIIVIFILNIMLFINFLLMYEF